MFYPADAVDKLASTLFKLGALIDLPKQDETIIRYFITTGSAFRTFMRGRESEFDPRLLQTVMKLPLSQFIWIVEFATPAEWVAGQISARAVIDATASLRELMPLWLFHSRKQALVFDRNSIALDFSKGMGALQLADTGHSAFTRMDQNLRPTQTK